MLDAGAGTGFFARLLAGMAPPERDVRVTGLDSDPALIHAASKLAAQAGLEGRVRSVAGDACRLPFPDGGFDLVASHTLLGVLSQPLRAIREQVRVARVGGMVAALESIPGLPEEGFFS